MWEEGQVPAVVFEVTSPKTQEQDQHSKRDLYEQMGVAEYWLFDPKGEWIPEQLRGYRLVGEEYVLNSERISHQLGLRLEVAGTLLNFYRLSDGQKLQTLPEMAQQAAFERQRAERLAQRLRELGVDPES
jgi:Uma2 family endonuclease